MTDCGKKPLKKKYTTWICYLKIIDKRKHRVEFFRRGGDPKHKLQPNQYHSLSHRVTQFFLKEWNMHTVIWVKHFEEDKNELTIIGEKFACLAVKKWSGVEKESRHKIYYGKVRLFKKTVFYNTNNEKMWAKMSNSIQKTQQRYLRRGRIKKGKSSYWRLFPSWRGRFSSGKKSTNLIEGKRIFK